MMKLHVLALALVAVFALGAITAVAASAELAEWLENGNPILPGELLPMETSGETLLEDVKTLIGAIDVLCSGILDGNAGPDGEGEIAKVLTLSGVEISELAGAKPLINCANPTANCTKPEVYVEKLPWKTLLTKSGGVFTETVEGTAFDTVCETFLGKIEDLCEASASSLPVVNGVNDVETPANSKLTPNMNCTQGGSSAGVTETETATLDSLVGGASLQVS